MPKQKDRTLFEEVERLERTSPNGVTFDVLKRFAKEIENRITTESEEIWKTIVS